MHEGLRLEEEVKTPVRIGLLALLCLSSGPAWAQDACSEKCSTGVPACIGKCEGEPRCSNNCTKRMADCMARCNQKPEKSAAKGKKCTGANGKAIQCPDYREPKRAKDRAEPEEEYPNKAAQDLAKDPNFRDVKVE